MPATITHAYFAEDVYKNLEINIQKKINKDKLLMFAQNTDSFLFYNILSLKRGKHIRNLQKVFHEEKCLLFFTNTINYIKEKKYFNDSDTISYLYGFITHYILDSTVHPFVFYKTGLFIPKDKDTWKYNGGHTYMETYIDNYLLNKRNYSMNFNKCFDLKPFSKNLNNVINYGFLKTYNEKDISLKYYSSLKQMHIFLNLFRKDYFGIKRNIYSFFDIFTSKKIFKLKTISYNLKINDDTDFLNNKHKNWCYPADKNIKSNENFDDLYQKAIIKAVYCIEKIHSHLFDNKNINLEEVLENKSYVTGIDCNSKFKQKYFEF